MATSQYVGKYIVSDFKRMLIIRESKTCVFVKSDYGQIAIGKISEKYPSSDLTMINDGHEIYFRLKFDVKRTLNQMVQLGMAKDFAHAKLLKDNWFVKFSKQNLR